MRKTVIEGAAAAAISEVAAFPRKASAAVVSAAVVSEI